MQPIRTSGSFLSHVHRLLLGPLGRSPLRLGRQEELASTCPSSCPSRCRCAGTSDVSVSGPGAPCLPPAPTKRWRDHLLPCTDGKIPSPFTMLDGETYQTAKWSCVDAGPTTSGFGGQRRPQARRVCSSFSGRQRTKAWEEPPLAAGAGWETELYGERKPGGWEAAGSTEFWKPKEERAPRGRSSNRVRGCRRSS